MSFEQFYKKELITLNNVLVPIFIILSNLGILIFIYDDYLHDNEYWKLYTLFRVGIAINGFILLYFFKKDKISVTKLYKIFVIPIFIFFAYGVASSSDHAGITDWNNSIAIAAFIWPAMCIFIKYYYVVVTNLIFFGSIVLFFNTVSMLTLADFAQKSGLLLIFFSLTGIIFVYIKNIILKNYLKT